MSRTVRSFCRVCQAHCGIEVELDGQQILRVGGDRDHPVSRGYTCSKGRSLGLAHHDPDRLDQPELLGRRATWDEVLGDLADRLRAILNEHGPDAIACYRSTGWVLDTNARSVIDRWVRAIGSRQMYSPATIDTPNRTLVPDLMIGAPFVQPVVDWDETELLLVVGHNLIVSHGHATAVPDPVRRIRALRARGGSVVVVDPRVTETARLADAHLQLRPGTDAALLAHFVATRLQHRFDQSYMDAHVAAGSLDRLREAVRPFADPETVAARCDVDIDELRRADALLCTHDRMATVTGTGVSMGAAPNAGEWLSWALHTVTGSLDRRGGVLFNPGVIRPQSESGPTRIERETGPRPSSRPEFHHAYGEYPSAILCDEILSGKVRALLSFGGNIAASFPDSTKTAAALRSLDVFAVSELRHTRSTEFATHVLATCGQLERHDATFFIDQAFPIPFAQYSEPVVEPVGDRRELWRVMADVAGRMGIELPGVDPDADGRDLVRSIVKRARVPFDVLAASPSGVAPQGLPVEWLVPAKLPTGTIDVAPAALVDELAGWLSTPAGDPSLQLICRRLPHQMNSDLQELPSQQRAPFPTLLMHPEDAVRLNVEDGAVVEVSTTGGATEAVVELSSSIKPGVVSLPHSWRKPDVNALTSTLDLDPLTGMPRFSGLPVEVARQL